MSNTLNQNGLTSSDKQSPRELRSLAADALSKAGDSAKEVVGGAKDSANALASEANEKIQGFLDQQVASGADVVKHTSASVKVAADDLARNVPQLAEVVRGAAQKMENFSTAIRGQSVAQLARTATDFARERPVVVFGAAAACGFFLLRVFKAGAATVPASRPRSTGDYETRSVSNTPTYGRSHGGT